MKILLDSLGCDKNLVDAEQMLAALADKGFEFTDNPEEAEIYIVNSCCFIDSAKEESINAILEGARLKEEANVKALVVTGCLAQRYKDEILGEIPEIDAITGIDGVETIADAVEAALNGIESNFVNDANETKPSYKKRMITTGGLYEYLKIAEGCDKNCTYCVIPKVRGHYRSVPMEDLLTEAKELADAGVKELIIVAQETTLYGTDLYGKKSLHLLLKELCKIEGIKWIRVMYCYPEEIYQELIDTIAEEEKICKYLDVPIQHINDTVLKRMNRRTNGDDIRRIVSKLRAEIPDLTLRTTLISGFPGENEEMHEELLEFVKQSRFDRLGVFEYSCEEGTPASRMKEQVTDEEKTRRRDEIMEAQQLISAERGSGLIGKVTDVLIEGVIPEDGVCVGRTQGDAPDVDGYIFIENESAYMTSDCIKVQITEATEYDLIGEVYYESAE